MSLYPSRPFEPDVRTAAARLMHDTPFATPVTPASPEPILSHAPLLLQSLREPCWTRAYADPPAS